MDRPGIGPAGAARILADVGDVAASPPTRFPSWTGTAPDRRLLRRAGAPPAVPGRNRRLNHVPHIGAVVQLRNDTPGRAYFRRKHLEGKGGLEAMRCLKRRLSDLVHRQLVADSRTPGADHDGWAGPGGHSGATLQSGAVDLPPDIDTSDQSLPGPAPSTLPPRPTLLHTPAASAAATQRRRTRGVKTQRPPDERS